MRRVELNTDRNPTLTARVWLVGAVMFTVLASLWPLDVIPPGTLWPKVRGMILRGPDLETFLSLTIWVLCGTVAAASARNRAQRGRLAVALFAVAVSLEGVQIFASARHASLTDGLLGGLVAAGAAWFVWPRANLIRRAMPLASLALLGLLVLAGPILVVRAALLSPMANWTLDYPIAVGAEPTGVYAWTGTVDHFAIYTEPLTSEALGQLSARPIFSEDAGFEHGVAPLPTCATIIGPDGNELRPRPDDPGANIVSCLTHPNAALEEAQRTQSITIALSITAGDTDTAAPARIVTNSPDKYRRNFTVGQIGNGLFLRVRTPWSGTNGIRQGFTVWPNVFQAGQDVQIVVSYSDHSVSAFADGAQIGTTRHLYRPRFEAGHDGIAGDVAILGGLLGVIGMLTRAAVGPGSPGLSFAAALPTGFALAGAGIALGDPWSLLFAFLTPIFARMGFSFAARLDPRRDGDR
jgi:VanZ family protein